MIRVACHRSRLPAYAALLGALMLTAPSQAGAQQAVASPHGTLPEGIDCSACHTAQGWQVLREPLGFHHGDRSGFLVSGAHERAKCTSCHLDLRFDGPEVAMSDCASCHADVHAGRMVQECVACHTTTSFRDVNGELVHARTSFPLTGAHRQVTCESCHRNDEGGAFAPLDTECASCHLPAYETAQVVDHVGSGYPTDCTQCHSTLAWADTPAFDHVSVSGGFELLGAHDQLRCASCHVQPGMALLHPAADQNDCVACHQSDYDRQHGGGGFPTTCLACHTVDSWDDADFDHALTGFALVEPHAGLECSHCHTGGQKGLRFPVPSGQNDCVACHQADYDKEHGGSGYPTTCISCHKSNSWDDASFNHGATAFPLVGAHSSSTCADCHGPPAHLSALFHGAETCVACHQTEYDANHAGSDFPTTCLSCHTADTWVGAVFDHGSATGFGLEGPHVPLECTACHAVPTYTLLFPKPASTGDCVACHQGDYDANHAGSEFPTTCLTCHAATTWSGATVDHVTIGNGFALLGAHAVTTCSSCHAIPGYTLVFPKPSNANDCVACHQVDYISAHGASGYPTDCSACHSAGAWKPSTFDHDSQYFPIYSGEHREAWSTCTQCHPTASNLAVFSCVTCHEHSQTSMDDKHKEVSGYTYVSSACLSCHPTGKAD